ncbi:MAG TPA: ADP-ribosylglycohydrolase family protein [Prosthecobacter sp.]|nr:ADP-ribosylglycohydrolase family protein [Prosthecobacter sp.]
MKRDLEGLLLGACVGDALGLPAEGLPPQRIAKRWRRIWKMRLLFGRGLVSDDTEHTVMVTLALQHHPADVQAFQRDLARRLRWWFAALPPGIGLATAKACIRLWLGFGCTRSGVFSAGNGPAMRSAIIGAYFADDPFRRGEYVRASTRITHIDPKAEVAARAVADTAAWVIRGESVDQLLRSLTSLSADAEWQAAMRHIKDATAAGMEVGGLVHRLGLSGGPSGYAYHTVPVALYAFLHHRGDYRNGLEAALNCGGDTDTVGAIAGALLGLSSGVSAIPAEWLGRISDWPLSVNRLRNLARNFCDHTPPPFSWWHWLLMPARNMVMLAIVLAHGFRRLV